MLQIHHFSLKWCLSCETTSRVCSQQDFSRIYTGWSKSTVAILSLPLLPVLLQLVRSVVFLPVPGGEGPPSRGRRVSCIFLLTSRSCFPSLCCPCFPSVCTSPRDLNSREPIWSFSYILIVFLSLNLITSPEFFKKREGGEWDEERVLTKNPG